MRLCWTSTAALSIIVLAVACAPATPDTETPPPPPATTPDEPGDAEPPEPPAEPPDEPEEADDADEAPEQTLFFGRATDERVWVEPETVPVAGAWEASDVATQAMTTLFGATPADPALFTAVPPDIEVQDVVVDDGVLLVSVDASIMDTSGSSTQEVAFANQLAHTAAEIDGVEQVRLQVDGATITDLWGHLDWSLPFAPDPFSLTPIVIREPAHAAELDAGTIVAAGDATVFEASFELRLRDADGTVREEVVVTASAGGPERGTWTQAFTITTPGDYVLEASEIDASGGEGRTPVVVERAFTIVAR
ncbi:MAG: Gmad2 immunoglobulin-like domain-containing protein [Nitriliruptoraceae bacterium]